MSKLCVVLRSIFYCITVFAFALVNSISTNAKSGQTSKTGAIVIAVIDDAFRVNHELFDGVRWVNEKEVPNNGIDDDQNGYVDDVYGWDVSDQDANLMPPSSRYDEFTHGTKMAGLISQTLKKHLEETYQGSFKLMFIKAVPDSAQQLNLKDGYSGIDYALNNGADIISLSWSGGLFNQQASKALNRADQADVTVLASMGNFSIEDPSYPSAHPAVLGVAGVNDDRKLISSNYGAETDFVALSTAQKSADVSGDRSYSKVDGASAATAIVAAQAAIVKHYSPSISKRGLKHCLLSTAQPVDKKNLKLAGQLGAGFININESLECVKNLGSAGSKLRTQAKGSIFYQPEKPRKAKPVSWKLRPFGEYQGMSFTPSVSGKPGKTTIKLISSSNDEAIWNGYLRDLPNTINSPYSDIDVFIEPASKRAFSVNLAYATKNIDLASVFCSGQIAISAPAVIHDGSGDAFYNGNSNCRWLITPNEGYDIGLTFTQLDTELNTDSVYLFRGDKTLQDNFLARFSGKELPYKIIVERGQALLWFLSDNEREGQGFKLNVTNEKQRPLIELNTN